MVDIVAYKPTPLKNLMANIDTVKFNPSLICETVLNHLNDVTRGLVDIVDPTNPFVFLLEAASVCAASAMNENDINTRRLYPALAQSYDDLYLHMSDLDYVNRFAKPTNAVFTIMYDENALLNALVDTPAEQCRKAVMPRNTQFKAAGVVFSLEYPVVIRHNYSGSLEITFDNTVLSPFSTIPSNIIDHVVLTDSAGIKWVKFMLDTTQFSIVSSTYPVTASSAFMQLVSFNQAYYHTRVFYKTVNGTKWIEIPTTHTTQVYNPTIATAVLRVTNKQVAVHIPPIYIENGLVSGTIRIDVYETVGALSLNMANLNLTSFTTTYLGIDDIADNTIYTNAINSVSAQCYSDSVVNGGAAEMSFDTLRTNVISNSMGPQILPITNNQLINSGASLGFTIVPNVDSLTNRIFTAYKPLPQPTDKTLVTPCSMSIDTATVTVGELSVHGSSVKDNGLRQTITPKALFTHRNGIVKIIPESTITEINGLNSLNKVKAINTGDFIYSPFYYVLDTTNKSFTSRAYDLDSPKSSNLSFISQNTTAELQVNTYGYGLSKTDTGFVLTVMTKSDDRYKAIADANVGCILTYKPTNETNTAYITGVMRSHTTGTERTFDFNIQSNLDIDAFDNLMLDGFNMLKSTSITVPTTLTNTFNIIHTTNSIPLNHIPGYGDSLISGLSVPKNTITTTIETVMLKFGSSLKNLWVNTNSAPNINSYARHTVDVPLTYDKDTYDTVDANVGSVLAVVNGTITYPPYHLKGSPVINPATNTPFIKHAVGDVLIGVDGLPVILPNTDVTRYVDMLFVEGVYYWANDISHVNYRKEYTDLLSSWINNDLGLITPKLLEQTKLFYYSKRNVGAVTVLTNQALNNVNTIIPAKQSLVVDYYVRNSIFNDLNIRTIMETNTVVTLDKLIKTKTVSITDMTLALKALYGTGIISVKVSGLGGALNLEAVTVINEIDGLSLNKVIKALEDGTLITKEDVLVNFHDHELVLV